MSRPEDVWIPLVDEPIGSIVAEIQKQHPEIAKLVDSPHRMLAFRTFAYIRVGILLGQQLVEHDIELEDGSNTWVEKLLREPTQYERVVDEVRTVAEEIAADPAYASEEPLGPDEEARRRFLDFAKKHLE
jgi:hypothetical protein